MGAPQFLTDYYWMHVRPDGLIEKHPTKPYGKQSLYVRVMADYEETVTRDTTVPHPQLRFLVLEPVRPPGDGWVKQRRRRNQEHATTIWRRPRS